MVTHAAHAIRSYVMTPQGSQDCHGLVADMGYPCIWEREYIYQPKKVLFDKGMVKMPF